MHTPLVFYLDSYSVNEEERLRQAGVSTIRVSTAGSFRAIVPNSASQGEEALIRGSKLTPIAYGEMCKALAVGGTEVRTSPSSYAALSNSEVYERSIQYYVPKMLTWPLASQSLVEDISQLKHWGQAFIRSELGSAAKFAGIENCFIRGFAIHEIEEKLERLKQAHPTASRIIVRDVIEVKKIDGKSVEGRFIILNGSVCHLDHFEPLDLSQREKFLTTHFESAATVANSLLKAGITGDYFVDIAERTAGGWFVVEIKPLLDGTIRDVGAFASALLVQDSPK